MTSVVEYRLLVHHTYDQTVKRAGILFLLETTKQFTNFAYTIDVQDRVEKNSLLWSLHGLRTPSMNMPSTGTAQFQKVYFDLGRKITFTLEKKGNLKVSIEIKFHKDSVTVSTFQKDFLKIYVDEQEFEQRRLQDSIPPELKPDVHRKQTISQQQKKK